MKKTITLMLGIVLLTTIATAQNLVTNSGFEDVDPATYTVLESGKKELMRVATFQDGVTLTVNPTLASAVDVSSGGIWLKKHPTSGYFKARVIDTDSHTGANCVNMFIPVGSTQIGMGSWYNLVNTQKITTPLSNSKIYKASVWAKADATVGNVCSSLVLYLSDNVKKANITTVIPLTGGTTWTKYDATFNIPAFVALAANTTADFSTAFFGCGILTTYTGATTNYSGILLDDYSLIEDTTTALSNVLYLKGNPIITSHQTISSTLDGKLEVYNISGSKVLSKSILTGENVLLSSGLYFIQLTTTEGTYKQKIVL